MTLSIVARCPSTGELGVAVASCVLAVGVRIPVAQAGVGAVAVQAHGWLHWRQSMLGALESGLSAAEAVEMHTVLPDAPESQFAAIGRTGPPGVFTGPDCVGSAGHAAADHVSAQANTMASEAVWPVMLEAFQQHDGALARRLVAALRAGDDAGGDYRGRQSASVLVVSGDPTYTSTGDADDPTVDLRVDDAADPVADLRRLLDVHDAHREVIRSAMTADPEAAAAHLRRAGEIAPDDRVVAPLRAIRLALAGDVEQAEPLLRRAARINPSTGGWARRRAEAAVADGSPHGKALLNLLDRSGLPS